MAYVLGKAADLYHYLNVETADPRTNDWFLMSSPVPTLILLTSYLYFVLKSGPRWMRNRPAFKIEKLLIVYNFLQIIACTYLVYTGVVYTYGRDYCITCQPVDRTDDPNAMRVASAVHMYFLLKVADLLDTVFFVLRKNDRQVSFLHLYHHTGMVVLTWAGTKWFPGGHSVFTGFLNSIIHIVMYGYYLLTAFSPKYKGNVWWKKYITQMQIVQFFMITAHWVSLLVVEPCGFPLWPAPIMISQNFLMLALFGDFYRKSYLMKKPTPLAATDKALVTSSKKEINDTNNNVNNNVAEDAASDAQQRTTVDDGSSGQNGLTKRH